VLLRAAPFRAEGLLGRGRPAGVSVLSDKADVIGDTASEINDLHHLE